MLSLEILDTRFLSVATWYHLAFFAVSVAMFGLSAGAVRVYLSRAAFGGARVGAALARHSVLFAASIPVTHVINLCIPIPPDRSLMAIAALLLSTVSLAVPFYLAGIVVTLC